MLELKPRIDFGGSPWPSPATFSLEWLRGTFYPQQAARRDRVLAAIAAGEKRIAEVRKGAASNVPVFGERRANGTIYRDAQAQQLQDAARSLADAQAVDQIRKIRQEIDGNVLPDIQDMERAAITARTLSERVFDLINCLSRVTIPGMGLPEMIALKSNYASLIRGVAANELHRMAQAAIDDGSPQSLIFIDCIRMENSGRTKDDRPWLTASLLERINVPEHNEAVGTEAKPGLLRQVVALHKEAGTAWAGFLGRVGQASVMRIARGLAGIKLDRTGLPAAGSEE